MSNDISIQDESGDKKYFTLVPNYVLNHSSAIDQSLYLQMKKFAGENGKCTASKNTLMKKMDVGEKLFNKSLKYLIDHKWVTYAGDEAVQTAGGYQKIKTYKINDIWKHNIEFYEGGVKRDPLTPKVVSKGVSKVVSKVGTNKNIYITNIDSTKKIKTLSYKKIDFLDNPKVEDLEELRKKFPALSLKQISEEMPRAADWVRSKGKPQKDYKAFFRNWLRKAVDFGTLKEDTYKHL